MKHDPITLIDEHIVVSCSIADAYAHLPDPAAVAAWFGAWYRPDRTIVDVDDTTLQFCHQTVEWLPGQHAIIVDGTITGARYHAHLTLRSVVRPGARSYLHEATEIWAHVELASTHATETAEQTRAILRRGLEHLRLELDTTH